MGTAPIVPYSAIFLAACRCCCGYHSTRQGRVMSAPCRRSGHRTDDERWHLVDRGKFELAHGAASESVELDALRAAVSESFDLDVRPMLGIPGKGPCPVKARVSCLSRRGLHMRFGLSRELDR
jgi:hypothetical protein